MPSTTEVLDLSSYKTVEPGEPIHISVSGPIKPRLQCADECSYSKRSPMFYVTAQVEYPVEETGEIDYSCPSHSDFTYYCQHCNAPARTIIPGAPTHAQPEGATPHPNNEED